MSMRRFRPMLAVLWTLMVATLLSAQTGETDVTCEEIEAIPLWQPRPMGEGVSPTVDLRPWLPPIGEQSMNDCTGWAAAYMAKSYQEAIDQEWRPDAPTRIFSPLFVYNQLNQGTDNGANLIVVARFLRENGCATLASMPYRPGDFRSQPTPAAIAEAKNFRIASWQRIQTGDQIRLALQQRYIVLLSARVGPTFLSGRFDRWTTELHERDARARKPGQPHALHAMAIVGADDGRQAFLVANSWGTRWNQQGFCLISYDVLTSLDPRDDASTFGRYALVLEDEPHKLSADDRPDVPADKRTLAIRKAASHAGFDREHKCNRYEFTVSLTGQRKALQLVSGVEWRWSALGETQRLTSRSPEDGFRVSGIAYDADAEITALLSFADNTTTQLSIKLGCKPPDAGNRDIRLQFTNRYAGRNRAGQPMWHWQARPVGRLADFDDIDHVRYDRSKIDPREPQATISRSFDYEAATSGFATAPAPLVATVVFRDGGEKRIEATPVFDAPVVDEPQLLADVRDTGVGYRGRRLFAVTVRTLVPVFDGTRIERVEYDFGPTLGDYKTTNDRFVTDFDESVNTTRDFRLLATVKYRDGRVVRLDRWISIGPTGAYANDSRLDVDVADDYYGQVGPTRKWRVTLTPVGDTEPLRNALRVTYRFANPRSNWKLPVERDTDPWLRASLLLEKPADLVAEVNLASGKVIELPVKVRLLSPVEDAPRLMVGGYSREEFIGNTQQPTQRVWVGLSMPETRQRLVDRVEYHLPSPHDRDHVVVQAIADSGGRFVIDRRIDGTIPLLAHVVTRDGWSEWLDAELSPGPRPFEKTGRQHPRVRVRERWYGVENGKALHDVEFTLDGPADELAKIRRAVVHLPPELFPGDDSTESLDASNRFRAGILATRGFDASVSLERSDGSTLTQPLRVYCASPVPLGLDVRASPKWVALPDGRRELRTVLWLNGPGILLDQTASVTWHFTEAGRGERVDEQTVASAPYGSFAVMAFLDAPQEVRADVKLRDGKTRRLVVRVEPPIETISLETSDVFWGRNDRGKPVWLCTLRPVGLPVLENRLTYAQYNIPGGTPHYSVDAPTFATSFLTEGLTVRDAQFKLSSNAIQSINKLRIEPRSPVLDDKLMLRQDIIDSATGKLSQTRVVGPESLLRDVQLVTYTLQSEGREWKAVRRLRYGRTDGFELLQARETLSAVDAELLLRDGRTLKLSYAP